MPLAYRDFSMENTLNTKARSFRGPPRNAKSVLNILFSNVLFKIKIVTILEKRLLLKYIYEMLQNVVECCVKYTRMLSVRHPVS